MTFKFGDDSFTQHRYTYYGKGVGIIKYVNMEEDGSVKNVFQLTRIISGDQFDKKRKAFLNRQ